MILTEEQCRELEGPGPVRAVDPGTQQTYVLVPAEVYERFRSLLDEDVPDAAALVNEVMAEDDAGDPLLEGYQHYRKGAS